MEKKTPLTSEQIYKKNKRKTKIFKILSIVSWYVFLALTFVFIFFMLRNSIGNVVGIISKLDSDVYNRTELIQNYNKLADQWGEWELIGVSVRYIDIGNALFSGLMITFCILASASILLAVLLGKIIFPALKKHYENSNTEMVDLATLKSASQINEMSKRKEWF